MIAQNLRDNGFHVNESEYVLDVWLHGDHIIRYDRVDIRSMWRVLYQYIIQTDDQIFDYCMRQKK